MQLEVIWKYKGAGGFKILCRAGKRKFQQSAYLVHLLFLCLDLSLQDHFCFWEFLSFSEREMIPSWEVYKLIKFSGSLFSLVRL